MTPTVHLEFNPYDADHRRVAGWLADQPDPAEAVVRLVRAANEGERRLSQWEELVRGMSQLVAGPAQRRITRLLAG